MSYTVLARRYRSSTFDEVIGQEHVAQTLKRAISSDRIAHAYLFNGTRGVGKTSMARIMAKALNCLNAPGATPTPCLTCDSCVAIARGDDIDVIEIDAASNTGVDNVRDIIENAQYRPARSRYKVYIIDEVHMLSKSAFNALLKTLEEPPSHVKFILATTEPEKVLATILSRCQRYDFRNIPTREIAGHLREICRQEGIDADEDALLLVAKSGAGSMRDSLSLLDRLLSIGEKQLTVDTIEQLLGLPKSQLLFDLAQSIGDGDVKATLTRADGMVNSGLSVDGLIAALVDHLRNLLILRTCGPDSELVEVPGLAMPDLTAQAERFDPVALTQDIAILEELRRQVRQSQAGRALLDATLVRMALSDQFASIGELLSRLDGGGKSGGGGGGGGAPARARPAPPRPSPPAAPQRAPEFPQNEPEFPQNPPAARGGYAAAPDQKKKADELKVADAPAPAPATIPPAAAIATAPDAPSSQSPVQTAAPSIAVPPAPAVSRPDAPAASTGSAPSASVLNDIDLGPDDDLPRPGKVWDGPSVSLSELLRQQAAKDAASQPAAAAASPPVLPKGDNIEPASAEDLPAVWQALLKLLADAGPGLPALLSHGRLVSIEDGQAVIRYGSGQSFMVKQMERNGKKDVVRDTITKVLNRPIGVRFEVAAEADDAPPPARPEPPAARAQAVPQATRPAAAPPPPMPAPPPGIKLTPELEQSLREADPLVRSIMDTLGAKIIRVEET